MQQSAHSLIVTLAILCLCAGIFPVHGDRDNAPPTVALTQRLWSVREVRWPLSRLEVAGIVVTDDGEGTNTLSLSGADAALFEIVGTVLYLNEGAALDFETNPILDVTVAVNDPTVGVTPDGTASLSLAILNCNEPPANWVPTNPSMSSGGQLVFSVANGNAISTSDPDGNITAQMDLTASSGTLRLGSTAGLTIVSGDGTGAVSLRGLISAINAALEGMTFTPSPGSVGTATLAIITSDLGSTGLGWQTDVVVFTAHDVIPVLIAADITAPTVTDVNSTTADGTYGAGTSIDVTVIGSEALSVSGTPQLSLETGSEDAVASYVGGSGTTTLVFRYAVAANHRSPDLDCTGTWALALNGGTIRDASGNAADLSLPAPGSPHSLGAHRAIIIGTRYTLTYLCGAHGSLLGTTPQEVMYGEDGTEITARPDETYQFVRWTDGSTQNPRTDTQVTADITVTAQFLRRFLATVDAAEADGRGWWHLAGTYDPVVVAGYPLTLTLVHDPGGRLSGTATYTLAKDTAVAMPIKGGVKGTRGSITMKGSLRGSNAAKRVSVALALDLAADTANRQLVGRVTGVFTENGTSRRVDESLTLAIPGDMNGTWTLRFDLDQSGRTVGGTAELTLSNQVRHAFIVRGRTDSNDAAILTLTGDPSNPAAKAISIKGTFTPLQGGRARIQSFAGRGYGQAVGW